METKLKTLESDSTTKNDKVEYAMMCCEPMSNLSEEKPQEEPEKTTKKHIKKTEKQKHGEEHV